VRIFPRFHWWLAPALILLASACIMAVRIANTHDQLEYARMVKTESEGVQIMTAIRNYEIEYSRSPAASDNAGFVRALTHDNPRRIEYLCPSKRDLNARGEIVDAWGEPFGIFVDPAGRPFVISPRLLHNANWKRISDAELNRPLTGADERDAQRLDGWLDNF